MADAASVYSCARRYCATIPGAENPIMFPMFSEGRLILFNKRWLSAIKYVQQAAASVLPRALVFAFVVVLLPTSAQAFTYFDVIKRARALATERYVPPSNKVPESLRTLNFGQYQQIQQKPEFYLWNEEKSPFQIKLNHIGMQFTSPVKIHEVDGEAVRELGYNPEQFDFGSLDLDPAAMAGLGLAGFRVLHPINDAAKRDDEIASFLGATYFRMIGRGQVYGASARGLAIDTALPSGEQFPLFREFWIARPAPGDQSLTIYALMDAPSVTGAYRFILYPGDELVVDVDARLYFRQTVGKLGLAPLTSMYLYGSNQWPTIPNYRPELHDSDGLAIHNGNGEWLWRPLNNPRRLSVSSFRTDNPRGFGLMQRNRSFDRYEDLVDRYDLRPGVWVELKGDWGEGRLELVEIPTNDETNDNIVAFWVPDQLPEPDTPLQLSYRLYWTLDDTRFMDPNLAWVAQTRRAPGEVRGDDLVRRLDGTVGFVVDFQGNVLQELPHEAPVSAEITHNGNAEIVDAQVRRHPVIQGQRLLVRVKVKDAAKPVELRARLLSGETPISEVWSYQLTNEKE